MSNFQKEIYKLRRKAQVTNMFGVVFHSKWLRVHWDNTILAQQCVPR